MPKVMEIMSLDGKVIHSGAGSLRDVVADAIKIGISLSMANLSWANLTGANLSRANLTGADLYRADLTGADLTGAYGVWYE